MRRREYTIAVGLALAGCIGEVEDTEPEYRLSVEPESADREPSPEVEGVRESDLFDSRGIEFADPYAEVDWESYGRYKGQFHIHPHYGDTGPPHTVYDRYVELGYDVINLQPKSHLELGMPWPLERMGEMHVGWESRFPADDGVVAIPGVEYDDPQHLTGVFTEVMLEDIEDAGIYGGMDQPEYQFETAEFIHNADPTPETVEPLFFLAHPGRYHEDGWTEEWLEHYRTMLDFDSLLGLETITYSFGYDDRDLWDYLLDHAAPDRPVIGTSVDDISDLENADRGWVTFYLPRSAFDPADQRSTQESIFEAWISGQSSFSTVAEPGMDAPRIERVDRDADVGTITIDATDYDVIEWVSHGEVVDTGSTVEYAGNGAIDRYVRAQIVDGDPSDPTAITCTQAWHFVEA